MGIHWLPSLVKITAYIAIISTFFSKFSPCSKVTTMLAFIITTLQWRHFYIASKTFLSEINYLSYNNPDFLSEIQRCVHGSGWLHQLPVSKVLTVVSTPSKAGLKMADLLPSWNSRSFLFSPSLNNSIIGRGWNNVSQGLWACECFMKQLYHQLRPFISEHERTKLTLCSLNHCISSFVP